MVMYLCEGILFI